MTIRTVDEKLIGWLNGIATAIREGRADHMGDSCAEKLEQAATLIEQLHKEVERLRNASVATQAALDMVWAGIEIEDAAIGRAVSTARKINRAALTGEHNG